ncbi:MAG: RNA methyltransferase [Sphaerochaetaceae bacterium]|nr:RNA methyltransferase [Sphaerochaetaceae bacterium]
METDLDRVEIILVDTQDGANIGSACRAMKTMGLSRLTLVTNRTYDENRVKTLALHAFDLYENRREFSSLSEALEGCILSVAATRRRGKDRKLSSVTPAELAQKINGLREGRVSIVFGCESSGLTDEQVHLCSMVVTIPTSEVFPSLNLSQAVQIISYELFQKLKRYPSGGNAVSQDRCRAASEKCVEALEQIGYFKVENEKNFTAEYLSDMFARCSMTEGEIRRFEKIFSKTSQISRFRLQTGK